MATVRHGIGRDSFARTPLPRGEAMGHNAAMMTRANPAPTLWASGGFTLQVAAPGLAPYRVSVRRPFAVLGRSRGDVVIRSAAVSGRHVYFHLDQRGVFAVDLATRTGSRIGPEGTPWAWLDEGDSLEVAGARVDLLEWHLDEAEPVPESEPICPLDAAGPVALAGLTLYPEAPPGDPLTLDSRLVFAGRSSACGVTIEGSPALRVHCALVRGQSTAYVVDLVGHGTWRNEAPVQGAEPLRHGDTLMIGTSRFQCRVEPPGGRNQLPAVILGVGSTPVDSPQETTLLAEFETAPLHLIPTEAQAAVLGWMLGQIQSRQDESLRRQGEFQTELVRLVAEIHRDNQTMLNRHLERSEEIHREVHKLREEVMKRFVGDPQSTQAPSLSHPIPELPPPLKKIPPAAPPESPEAAVNWLIARASQLDHENRKSWKDLLGRLSGPKSS